MLLHALRRVTPLFTASERVFTVSVPPDLAHCRAHLLPNLRHTKWLIGYSLGMAFDDSHVSKLISLLLSTRVSPQSRIFPWSIYILRC